MGSKGATPTPRRACSWRSGSLRASRRGPRRAGDAAPNRSSGGGCWCIGRISAGFARRASREFAQSPQLCVSGSVGGVDSALLIVAGASSACVLSRMKRVSFARFAADRAWIEAPQSSIRGSPRLGGHLAPTRGELCHANPTVYDPLGTREKLHPSRRPCRQ